MKSGRIAKKAGDADTLPHMAPLSPSSSKPLIGITTDVVEAEPIGGSTIRLRAVGAMTYVNAVTAAGGIPILLPPVPELAQDHAARCDAIVMTGGNDPRTEAFGQPTHPRAEPMHPLRQAYEFALLAALADLPTRPVLGVCLGMQLMSLHAGGKLNQCLAETLPTHAEHIKDHAHPVLATVPGIIHPGTVASNHRQGVDSPGQLRVVARSHDGVIEAVDDPSRPFYLGVQWHPERTHDPRVGADLFARLVAAARSA